MIGRLSDKMKIGLKLWSTNTQRIPVARDLFVRKVFDYIELFVVPGSGKTIPLWKALGIPYILHAPHSVAGFNPADPSCRDTNLEMVKQAEEFFYALLPEFVIFHPGLDGDQREAVFQFRTFESQAPSMYEKVFIENKPQVGLRGERCLGASPEEIRFLMSGTGRGFCLDFGHAICYSISAGKGWKDVLADFLTMDPAVYHLCDGFYSPKDGHEHLGAGEFDLPYLIGLIGPGKHVTLETGKEHLDLLDDFERDVQRLREYAGI